MLSIRKCLVVQKLQRFYENIYWDWERIIFKTIIAGCLGTGVVLMIVSGCLLWYGEHHRSVITFTPEDDSLQYGIQRAIR